MAQFITSEEAANLIQDNQTIAILGSGGGLVEPSLLLQSIGSRFLKTGKPRNLTVFHACGIGNKGQYPERIGTDALAYEGLVKCDIAGHWGLAPRMAELAKENKIEAFNLPQGVMALMYNEIAGHRPGVITKVGLHTFIDPRYEGGKMNDAAKNSGKDLVRLLEIDGEEWLFYPSIPINVSLIRGTCADPAGNITFEEETATLDALTMAQAAHNSGGIVIAQVKYRLNEPANAQKVVVPGIVVDYVVVNSEQKQTCETYFDPSISGTARTVINQNNFLPMSIRKIVARRAAMELSPGMVVNLGVGMPDGIAACAQEMGILDSLHFTVEQGVIGGMPLHGLIFGCSRNPDAIIGQDHQFNFYDGGGLDCCCLGMAQIDNQGDVNSSKTGTLLSGCGGAINISQGAKKVIFCGTFTAKGLKESVADGKLIIEKEGNIRKFVNHVDQITFSGKYASEIGQTVVYITERAVFQLVGGQLVLTEIAPGVDLKSDILDQMDFKPLISENLKEIDRTVFC